MHCRKGVTSQWMQILRNILNGHLKIVQDHPGINSGRGEREYDQDESEFENPATLERNGFKPRQTNKLGKEDALNTYVMP